MKFSPGYRLPIRGFTLVELLMCLGIMILMTGILMWKYPDSTMKMNLLNDTHSLALLIREAQVRGSSVDSLAGTVGGYGVFIDLATSSKAVLFKDRVDPTISSIYGLGIGNGLYESVPSNYTKDEYKSALTLQPRYIFKKLCVQNPLDVTKFICGDDHSPHINSLVMSFNRPSAVAHIYINNSSTTEYASACIELNSPNASRPGIVLNGHIRSVLVYHSGMITTSVTGCE